MNRISFLLAGAAFFLLTPGAFAAQVEVHQGDSGQQVHIHAPTEDSGDDHGDDSGSDDSGGDDSSGDDSGSDDSGSDD